MGLAQMRIESVLPLINIIQTLLVQGGKKPYIWKLIKFSLRRWFVRGK